MRSGIVFFILFMGFSIISNAQNEGTFTYNGDRKARVIAPGVGKTYTENFIFFDNLHFVQFGVYSADYNRYDIKAPENAGQVWLIYHQDTQVRKASNFRGAYYMVKAFGTAEEAKLAVKEFKSKKTDCWYNPELTNVKFTLIGITGGV